MIDGLEKHESKYLPNAFDVYTGMELGAWVHLFLIRSEHRNLNHPDGLAGAQKDVTDAQNYLNILQDRVSKAKEKVNL